jgi:hypothetical protein
MKLLFTAMFLISINTISFCQHMILSAQTEYTVAGPQYGASTMFESKKQLGAGVFYQMDVNMPGEKTEKDTFYGAQLQLPFAKSEKLSFFGTIRGGMVNDKFIVIVPGLETRIHVGKRMAVAFGMSMRMNYPAVSGKVICKIF